MLGMISPKVGAAAPTLVQMFGEQNSDMRSGKIPITEIPRYYKG